MDIKDKALELIENANKIICKNIDIILDDRGFLSSNILAQLRNLVEGICLYTYSKKIGSHIFNDYEDIKKAVQYLRTQAKYREITQFHSLLQKSTSHYTLNENSSERLMLKYYTYLLKVKKFMESDNIDILQNIEKFPINQDYLLQSYYKEIVPKLNSFTLLPKNSEEYTEKYYIQKIKPFFINQQIYYEVTFSIAHDYTSKFDHIIAFTKLDILPNYAVKLSIHKDYISLFGQHIEILIIDDWQVAIRQCEFKHLAEIFGIKSDFSTTKEYSLLMQTLKSYKMTLLDFVLSDDVSFNNYISYNNLNCKTKNIMEILTNCRNIIINKYSGQNILRYILYTMSNKIIKKQLSKEMCNKLSNLYLEFGCLPFEQIPFNTSLINHNPKISDLFECIDSEDKEDELLMHYVKNNTENEGILFTPIKDLPDIENIDNMLLKYNNKIYYKHTGRYAKKYDAYLYINEYVNHTYEIIKQLKELSKEGYKGYSISTEKWLTSNNYEIDCEEKKNILVKMFETSKIALVYGAAGTGKSTLINHISHRFEKFDKLYLTNTNPAINNLKRKINTSKTTFMTINKFLSSRNDEVSYNVLFIDECSTVSNKDMFLILQKAKFELLVLVGDIYQIESITFGNWFDMAQYFVPKHAIFELIKPYRSTNDNLLMFWNRVRKLEDGISEIIEKNNFSHTLDESIFLSNDEDEIILCLNYDGLYGINNINRFLQTSNPNPAIYWNGQNYKIGDPILFNETERFSSIFYNNLKGKICNIDRRENEIIFIIEVDKEIDEMESLFSDFELLCVKDGKSLVRFNVMKYSDYEQDNSVSSNTLIPFQIAYAVSIHKAQGLEYSSVKIVITNDVEKMVTHNIFYTAITRSKDKLKIYWSPETENIILSNLKIRSNSRDGNLLKNLYPDLKKI